MTVNHFDVLVVGLGPTGVTLANLLAQRGVQVAAFDKLPDLYPLPRAIGLDHEAMRILQEVGVTEQLSEFVAPYRPSEYRGADGKPILRLDAAPPPYRLGWAPNYVFNQPALERTSRTTLQQNTNAQIHTATEVIDFGQDENEAWVGARDVETNQVMRYTGAFLVACDGGASRVRKRLDIKFEDLGFDEAWLVIDAIVPPSKIDALPQTQVQYCDPERPATFVVGPGNHRRWEIMLKPGDSTASEFPEDELWALLERWVSPGEIELWRSAAYRFHGLVATQWRHGRILLAGDAAHMTPPFMAQGMVQGLRDAHNLAWKLDQVLSRRAGLALLDTYAQERRPHVATTTRAAIELGRIICECDRDKAIARDANLRTKQGGTVKTTVRQNMIPGLTAGLIDIARPGHGQIFPQPTITASGEKVLLDDASGRTFRLVVSAALTSAEQRMLLVALKALDGMLIYLGPGQVEPGVLPITEDDAIIEPWMSALNQRFVLVRPDHYIYGAVDSAELAAKMVRELNDRLYGRQAGSG